VSDLAKACPGCSDQGVVQVVNEFHDPEWCIAGVKDEDGDPLFICFCPYCGRMLEDPRIAPVRVSLTKAVKQLTGIDHETRLRARVAELETALEPFAKEWDLIKVFASALDNAAPYFTRTTGIKVGDIRRAAEALEPKP
jgi:hypothetical protein